MDPIRFDRLSRRFAARLTRRGILAGFGAEGVAASLDKLPSLAAGDSTTCVYAFDGTIDLGPSSTIAQNNTVAGELTITIGPDGAIDSGKLVRNDGTTLAVVGEADGRAVSLRFSVPKTGAFIAVGTGRHAIAECTPAMAGPASGPLRQDAGSWTATLKSSGAAVNPTATAASTTDGAQPTPAATEATTAPDNAATPGANAQIADGSCDLQCGDDTLGLDPAACACLCPSGQISCASPGHSPHAKGGVIFRPSADAKPVGFCVDASSDISNCGACNQPCLTSAQTSAVACVAGVCEATCAPGFDTCGGAAACGVDLSNDKVNCGACGAQCSPKSCVAGQCVCDLVCGGGGTVNTNCACDCPSGTTSCNDACVDSSADPDNCGGCGNACPVFARVCTAGQCTAVASSG